MLTMDIPGFGEVTLKYLISDFTGTLSEGGRLLPGVRERLVSLADQLQIHILTADTFGVAKEELADIPCTIRVLSGEDHDLQKERYVAELGASGVVAFGNGNNDRRMLKAARVGVVVCQGEGCATTALLAADVLVRDARAGLDLLLHPLGLKATLRF